MLKVPERPVTELLKLADFFDQLDPCAYDQQHYDHYGVRCICGWSNYRAGVTCDDQRAAAARLGLNEIQAVKLFGGNRGWQSAGRWFWKRCYGPTPQHAARCLREIAVTGQVPAWW